MVKFGEELEYVGYRLKDVMFLCENARPAPGHGPEDLLRLIGDQARQAMQYLELAKAGGEH